MVLIHGLVLTYRLQSFFLEPIVLSADIGRLARLFRLPLECLADLFDPFRLARRDHPRRHLAHRHRRLRLLLVVLWDLSVLVDQENRRRR